MSVRSLDLLDLPSLPRFRRDVFPLDSARMLTRGNPLGAAALLAYLNPRRRVYTAVSTEYGISLLGQIEHASNGDFTRLTFLAPAGAMAPASILLNHLSSQAGGWGALYLMAEVDEQSPVFQELRRAGFSMYAWQRVWKLSSPPTCESKQFWQEASELDFAIIQNLHNQIVPPLIQSVDPPPHKAGGMICKVKDELKAYVHPESGPVGIWLQPLVHPDSDCVPDMLTSLLDGLPLRDDRPVYICVRSYQAWLEGVLQDLGAQAGPRQAVMVKRLAKPLKVEEKIPVLEKALKPAAPIASSTELLFSGGENENQLQ